MILKWLILLVMAMLAQDVTPSNTEIKITPELLKIYKEIQLNSYDMLLKEWETFKVKHGKNYTTEEEDMVRMKIYAQNKLIIEKHNDLYKQRVVTFSVEMNKFGDMTNEEFNAYYGFDYNEKKYKNRIEKNIIQPAGLKLPEEKDWRKEGAVTKVKNQDQYWRCGSSWAFSATGALEGYYSVKNHYLLELSEQNLIDCSVNFVNRGCFGGRPMKAFGYVKRFQGISSELSYPYESRRKKCRFVPSNLIQIDANYATIPWGDEQKLQIVVASFGPVSVIVDISDPIFRFYKKGVYSSVICSSKLKNTNNAMLVVGYGTDPFAGEYWLVKNSWSKYWGEEGYIRMARNRRNNCGIASEAVIPYSYV